jgi:hypothetical protein
VSISAPTCPHCGEPNPGQKDEKPTLETDETERAKTSAPRKENIAGMLGAAIFGLLAIVAIFILPSKDATTKNKAPQSIEATTTAAYKPDVVDDAMSLCRALEETGQIIECKVDGYGGTVDVTIDTTGHDARQLCPGVTDMLAKHTRNFAIAARWKLRIFSPYSGETPIAKCSLK